MHPEITKAWGKARPEGEGAQFHLLVYHALDVTAVGATYLRHSPALLGWLKHCLGIRDDEILIRWICFRNMYAFFQCIQCTPIGR